MANKRGPKPQAVERVLLKAEPHQLQRAMNDGRVQAHRAAEEVVGNIPALSRNTPAELAEPLSKEEWRKRIVDSVAGMKILRATDEPLVEMTSHLLAELHKMQLSEMKVFYVDERGNEKETGKFKAYMRMVTQLTKMLADLGLNPSTRARVIADTASAMKDVKQSQSYDWSRE